jgi:5-methyltetrahydrofolate--homocysteine methyltransferase
MTDHIRTLAEMASVPVSCFPNAGLPNEDNQYLETPESLAAQLEKFVNQGWLNIVGGCCGTTPAHIRAIAQMAAGKAPRIVPPSAHRAFYTGIDLVEAEESARPLIVGERTNVIGSRLFKSLIAEEKWEEASEIARWQVKKGAHIIDVCLQSSDREGQDQGSGDDRYDRSARCGTGARVVPGQEHYQLDQSGRRRRQVRTDLPFGARLWSGGRGRDHR